MADNDKYTLSKEGSSEEYRLHYDGWIVGSTDKEYVDNHRGEQTVILLDKNECKEIRDKFKDALHQLYNKK